MVIDVREFHRLTRAADLQAGFEDRILDYKRAYDLLVQAEAGEPG